MTEQWRKFEDWLFKPGQRKRLNQKMSNKWTSIKSGLPPENVQVLVWVVEAPYVDCFNINMLRNGQWVQSQAVTHWMIPEKPDKP